MNNKINTDHLADTNADTDISPPLSQDSVAVIRARQGVISGRVVTMLAVSTTLAIIALAVVWIAS